MTIVMHFKKVTKYQIIKKGALDPSFHVLDSECTWNLFKSYEQNLNPLHPLHSATDQKVKLNVIIAFMFISLVDYE